MTTRILAGAVLGLLVSTTAFAQSYTAPAGIPTATAPGGLEGRGGNFYATGSNYGVRGDAARGYSADDALSTGSIRNTRGSRSGASR
ncbi:hypothetical protein [Methylobacterium gnaphalii]|uniref:Uncharacterized protein n=1 Tax=Methylobacterium gnaphalii TaxID=1010610 RepID=A0A512JMF4_9HYPH|nr:hypothetical protein [Methylobacterium gnaphalii]GEP11156.1 hypothetical protein MGN01_30010 [Methylobacterium gnaphalii]GJD71145.1 hypothetical protein MMMDOFMJ_4099 [Methylobacterium gnaphalii]GLS49661.1 hypothetical protein GCM10007885_25110 [Methylobacterium gnaphalii]